jgi:hypothetical protein
VAEAEPGALHPHEEVALHEPVARLLQRGARDAAGQRVHGRRLEDVARDGPQREGGALRGVEPVQPRREQRVQRRRQPVRRWMLLAGVGDELFEEQRVPPRRLGDPLLDVPLQPAGRDRLEERAARCHRQRPELEHVLAADAARPLRAPLEQLGPRHPHEQRGNVAQARGHVEQQFQQRGLGQVRVVDDQDQRLRPRQRVDQPQEGPARILGRPALLEPGRHGDLARHRRRHAERSHELVDRALAHRLQHDLAERPVRRPLALGGAAARQQSPADAGDRGQPTGQVRLPDPGLTDDRQ